jgi:hypothetical protein
MNQNRTDPELLSFGKKKPDPFVGFQSFGLGEGLSGHFVQDRGGVEEDSVLNDGHPETKIAPEQVPEL